MRRWQVDVEGSEDSGQIPGIGGKEAKESRD